MTTDRMAELAEWWENAEESDVFYPGDTWIRRRKARTGGWVYDVGRVTAERRYYDCRILARAPKPKPAWHDAVAVVARKEGDYGPTRREVFTRCNSDGWESMNYCAHTAELIDPVPLMEVKVTDEMVERGRNIGVKGRKPDAEMVRRILSAALGLKTY